MSASLLQSFLWASASEIELVMMIFSLRLSGWLSHSARCTTFYHIYNVVNRCNSSGACKSRPLSLAVTLCMLNCIQSHPWSQFCNDVIDIMSIVSMTSPGVSTGRLQVDLFRFPFVESEAVAYRKTSNGFSP